ncbi:MAG TPA: RNA polymerase sigma factor [Kofleriaceae bacterium]|nr:RNA polymerase sigma factor [Kofleriaceae bacterium]
MSRASGVRRLLGMHEHLPDLVRIAGTLYRDPADAADLVQDTFERTMRRGGLPPDVRSPLAYLVTIMKNLARDRRRAQARRPGFAPLGEIAAEPGSPRPWWTELTRSDVEAVLDCVPAIYRDAFVLHVLERRTYRDIATRFAIQPVTVGSRLTRARKLLRAALQKRRETLPA